MPRSQVNERRNSEGNLRTGWHYCLGYSRRTAGIPPSQARGEDGVALGTNPDLSLVAGIGQIWAVGPPCSLSWREGSESDRVPPDLDQRLGLASKPIAKR